MKHAELESMVYNCSSPAKTVEPLIPKLVFKSFFFLFDGEFMDVIFLLKNSNHGDSKVGEMKAIFHVGSTEFSQV